MITTKFVMYQMAEGATVYTFVALPISQKNAEKIATNLMRTGMAWKAWVE